MFLTEFDPDPLGTIRIGTERGQVPENNQFCEMIESAIGRRGESRREEAPSTVLAGSIANR